MLKMAKNTALTVVDFSAGFMNPIYDLYVPGAEETIEPAKNFITQVIFESGLCTNDTHFLGEYEYSPEKTVHQFLFHQGFGTDEHKYQLDINSIQTTHGAYWLLKNKFDMWAPNSDVGVPVEEIEFNSPEERRVYNGLFHVAQIDAKGLYQFGMHRDEKIKEWQEQGINNVVVLGHATDYCVKAAVLGYLARGFKVTLLEDLCRGIWNTALEGGVPNIETMIARTPELRQAVLDDQLIISTSSEYVASLPKA